MLSLCKSLQDRDLCRVCATLCAWRGLSATGLADASSSCDEKRRDYTARATHYKPHGGERKPHAISESAVYAKKII